eukprot:COSAG03_NODE_202_length_10693_cov_87.311497_2_plen_77_part_00
MVQICAAEPVQGTTAPAQGISIQLRCKGLREFERTRAHDANDFVLVGTTALKRVSQSIDIPLQRGGVAGVRHCHVR